MTSQNSIPPKWCSLHTGVHYLPVESEGGRGFISLSTIFWCKARRLKGSTVNGRVPVSMAYMLTPLKDRNTQFSSAFTYEITKKIINLTTTTDCMSEKRRIHSHGPDIHLGPVLLPGEQLWGSIGWTSTLGAEWVWVSQDSSTVAETKIYVAKEAGWVSFIIIYYRFISSQIKQFASSQDTERNGFALQ